MWQHARCKGKKLLECITETILVTPLRAGRSGVRILVEARLSAPFQTGPEIHPTSYTMGTASFPGLKRPGRGVDQPSPSSAEVKKRVELYIYSPSGTSSPVLVNFILFWWPRAWSTNSGSLKHQQPYGPAQTLTLSDPTSDLFRQYDFTVLLRCRKTSDTVFVAFVRPLSEPARRLSSCSTDFRQQIAQVVLFLFLHVFLFSNCRIITSNPPTSLPPKTNKSWWVLGWQKNWIGKGYWDSVTDLTKKRGPRIWHYKHAVKIHIAAVSCRDTTEIWGTLSMASI
jgi:hypothetical protein